MNESLIFELLAQHSIAFQKFDHPPVFTCADANRIAPELPGFRSKNLFVRDRKGKRHILVVLPDEKSVDLEMLEKAIGANRLSLASEDRLKKYLNVEAGSVSILALMNDLAQLVEVVIDRQVWDSPKWQCHPLINTSTLVIGRVEIQRFLSMVGHRPLVIDVPCTQ